MPETKVCIYCSNNNQEVQCGEILSKDDVNVHSHCLFAASNLGQHGDSENDGIMGFWLEDINNVFEKSKTQQCEYCGQNGATVFCAADCQVKFHYSCGIENLCVTELFENFVSYCQDHRPEQKLPASFQDECPLCDGFCDPVDSFFLSCCNKFWIHSKCAQKEADKLGFDKLACPLCDSRSEFVENCQRFGGVFIRKKIDEEAEILKIKPNECSKLKCTCPYGPGYTDIHRFRFFLCTKCNMYKIHQSCREARDYPDFVCILCQKGKSAPPKFSVRKLGGLPSIREVVNTIVYPDSTGGELNSDLKEESKHDDEEDSEEKFKRRSSRKNRSTRSKPEVGFDAEFSDISSADDETAFEKEERESSRSRRRRDRHEDEDDEKVMVEGKYEVPKPVVNQFHPAIRDLTKPPRGTKFTSRRNLGGQFVPRPAGDPNQQAYQQKRDQVNLVKLDPQTILSLASSGNPANIEKADKLLQQLTSRFGGYSSNKPTIAVNQSGSHQDNSEGRGQQSYHDDKRNRDHRFQPRKGSWNKFDNRRDWKDDKNYQNNRYHRHQHQNRGRHDSDSNPRFKGRDYDNRGFQDRSEKHEGRRNRRHEQYNNASSERTPPKEKPNLAHVPKSLVDHVVRDIEKDAAAKAEAEQRARQEALEAKKRIEEELRKIQEEEDAKRREKEEKKAAAQAAAAASWKPLGEVEKRESDDEPEEGEADDSSDGESSSSSSSSDSEDSSETEKRTKGSENAGDEDKRPDVSELLEMEPEPEMDLTEEQQMFNLQKFSEQANEYKRRFRALEDGIRKLHTDVVFYAERCDQDMIQGVQSQCNLYTLEINRLFQLCKQMKSVATAEGTKTQVNTFVVKIGDAELELKKSRGIVDEFWQLIEKITILEELLVEQIKEEALIVEPIMKANDLRTKPKSVLDKVRTEIEAALADSSENPKSLHRNYEQFVNKLNSMLRNADVKLDKVGSLEASVMEHQENLGKHLKELRLELADRTNLKNYVDEIAKLLTSHKNTADHIESTKSHPDRAMSCIQSLRKEYKRLIKATDKYRVKYSSLSLELPDGLEDILGNLKETKAKLEIELESLVTKCESWKSEAVPSLDKKLMLNNNESKPEDTIEVAKKKSFGFQLKLSTETQKVIKDGNQLLKAQTSNNVVSDSSDNEDKSMNRSEDSDLGANVPHYITPLPKPGEQNRTPLMRNPVTSSAPPLMPPVPPQMPNMPLPPNFLQPPFMAMPPNPMFPPHMQNMQMPPFMHQPPQFPGAAPPGFPQPPAMPMPYGQMPNPYMQQTQTPYSSAPSLIQAQPMHYGQVQGHPMGVSSAPVLTNQISSVAESSDIDSVSVSIANMPDMSLIEAAAKALENVAHVANIEVEASKMTDTSAVEKKKRKKKKRKEESSDSEIEAVESYPKAQDLNLPPLIRGGKVNDSNTASVASSKDNSDAEVDENGDKVSLSKKARKDKRRKERKSQLLGDSDLANVSGKAEDSQGGLKKPSAFSYAAAMMGIQSDVLNSEETYDPSAPTIENYNHAVGTNSYEVVYRPEKADFVLVQKNSAEAAAAHAEQQQVSDAISAANQQVEELDEEALKKKEQLRQERKERRRAKKEALKMEREKEKEEEAKQGGGKPIGRSGPLSSVLSLLSQSGQNELPEEQEDQEAEEETVEPISCIHITSEESRKSEKGKTSPKAEVNSTTVSPPVAGNQSLQRLGSSTESLVSPSTSDKVTSSQPGFAKQKQSSASSSLEEGEEGEVNSDEDDNSTRVVFDKPEPRPVQDEKVNSSVSVAVRFSQEEPTSTTSDETLMNQAFKTQQVSVQPPVIDDCKSKGHTIQFEDEELSDNRDESQSSDDNQPSLVPGKPGKSKKTASLVPPPPPERKRKKQKKDAESSESSGKGSSDEDESSSSDETPQLTKKQLKKMMKFYAMFAKSNKSNSKGKRKGKKKRKQDSSEEEDSSEDEVADVKHRKRKLSSKAHQHESDSDSSSDDESPSKKKSKLKNSKSSPGKKAKASPVKTQGQQSVPVVPEVENEESDEINMSSFFHQDATVGVATSLVSSSSVASSSDSLLAKYLPEYSSIDSDPPLAALSRHFTNFWNYFGVSSDKDAMLARQLAIGLLESSVGFGSENKSPVSIQTQMVLTMLKNMKTW